jgi:hypothetical protein
MRILKVAIASTVATLLVVGIGASARLAQGACPEETAAPTLATGNAPNLQPTVFPPASPKFGSILAGAALLVPLGLSTLGLSCRNRTVPLVGRLALPYINSQTAYRSTQPEEKGPPQVRQPNNSSSLPPVDYDPGAGVEVGFNRPWLSDYKRNTGPPKLVPLPKRVFAPRVLGEVLDVAELGAPPPTQADSWA